MTWVWSTERSPGEGNGSPFQYSCLDTGAWRAIVYVVKKSQTGLSNFYFTTLLSVVEAGEGGGERRRKKSQNGVLLGLLWRSSGSEAMPPMQGAQVWFQVKELDPTCCSEGWKSRVCNWRPGAAKYINQQIKKKKKSMFLARTMVSPEAAGRMY